MAIILLAAASAVIIPALRSRYLLNMARRAATELWIDIENRRPEAGWSSNAPDTLQGLLEAGWIDQIPINPYTGKPIRNISPGAMPSPGDITYTPMDCTYTFALGKPSETGRNSAFFIVYGPQGTGVDVVTVRWHSQGKFLVTDDLNSDGESDEIILAYTGYGARASSGPPDYLFDISASYVDLNVLIEDWRERTGDKTPFKPIAGFVRKVGQK